MNGGLLCWPALLVALFHSACTGSAATRATAPDSEATSPDPAGSDSGGGTEPVETEPAVSETAAEPKGPRPPDFELDVIDGSSFRLGEHLGKEVVLLDFWATYCDPCLAAMPHLNDLYQRHKQQGLLIVGVSIDGPESIAQVRATVSRLGVEFPILLDDESSVVALYNPKVSAPFSVLIGKDGAVIAKREGYTTGKAAALDADIERALAR